MIRAVIFDCYGVLLGHGFEHTYAAAGGDVEVDAEFMHQQLTDMNSGTQTPEEFDHHISEHLNIPLERWQSLKFRQELPDARLLNFIKNELKPKYKIGMISNGSTQSIARRLSPNHLALFDVLVISAEVGLLKPDPKIYAYAAQKLAVDAKECAFVDDYEDYVEAAKRVGMKAIHYRDFNAFIRELNTSLTIE